MALLQWSPEYETGVPEIDDEHKRFFSYINDLQISMIAGRSREELHDILREIIDYSTEHFNTEESRMKSLAYPDYLPHKARHAYFLRTLREFQGKSEHQALGLGVEVFNFLRDWTKDHLLHTDKQFGTYYREHLV